MIIKNRENPIFIKYQTNLRSRDKQDWSISTKSSANITIPLLLFLKFYEVQTERTIIKY